MGAYLVQNDGCELQVGLGNDRDFLYPRSVNAAVDLHYENVTLGKVV